MALRLPASSPRSIAAGVSRAWRRRYVPAPSPLPGCPRHHGQCGAIQIRTVLPDRAARHTFSSAVRAYGTPEPLTSCWSAPAVHPHRIGELTFRPLRCGFLLQFHSRRLGRPRRRRQSRRSLAGHVMPAALRSSGAGSNVPTGREKQYAKGEGEQRRTGDTTEVFCLRVAAEHVDRLSVLAAAS